ncbi:MAG: hypothetical protein M3Q79_02470 [bacterium]|nr:hypothetical protein [bacterium]
MSEFIGPRVMKTIEKPTFTERLTTPLIVIGAAVGTVAIEAYAATLNVADRLAGQQRVRPL